jgi:cell division septation protein DedD
VCGILGVAALAPAWACAGDNGTTADTRNPSTELRGTELVVGSTLDEVGLLVLSPAGGKAVWRPLRDVFAPAWESALELPAFEQAHTVDGSSVVLLERGGQVSRFVPGAESIDRLDRLEADEVHWASSDQGGAFVGGPDGEIIAVTPDRAWRYEVGSQVEWAGVVNEGVAVLLPDHRLRLLAIGGNDASAATTTPGLRGPGLVTAWGRRLAFVDAGDDRLLRLLTVDPPETAGEVRLDGRITAISASPSTHELYAGLADPPAVATVNRFSFSQKELTRLDRAPVDLRPSLFGDFLLVYDGEQIFRIHLQDGEVEAIPGEWSSDLPIGLQDGAVLSRTAGRVVLVDAQGRTAEDSLVDASDATWLAVRWTPVSRLAAEVLEGQPVAVTPGRPAAATGGEAPPGADDAAPDPDAGLDPSTGRTAAADPGVPPGFYAIVGSARQREGIEALVEDLRGSGFPVRVQSTTDEANETWYRGLVGPFDTRAGAEAASRQLQRERQLQSWVMGIGANG